MNPSQQIDQQVSRASDWQAALMREFRELLATTAPELHEDWMWNVGVWCYGKKPVCAFSAFKTFVKFNFFEGAALPDPDKFFNSGLESASHRSINVTEADTFPREQLSGMIKAAITLAMIPVEAK